MAKSMRSKWRRKCRAVKRERYAVKELARLKKTLGIEDNEKVNEEVVKEASDVITFVCEPSDLVEKKKRNKKNQDDDGIKEEGGEDKMEIDEKSKSNIKSLRNKDGSYPVWIPQRKIRKHKEKTRKRTKKV